MEIDPVSGPVRVGIANTLVQYDFMWQLQEAAGGGESDVVTVYIKVAETRRAAHKYVMERFYNSASPSVSRPDDPIVVGDVSFHRNGRRFIRGNIVVNVKAFGAMNDRTRDVAEHIDAFLLTQPTAASAEAFKPVVERLEAVESPGTQGAAQIFVEASDPYGGTLMYEWQGTDVNEVDGRYYLPVSSSDGVAVALLIMNPMGFYTKATIGGSVTEGFVVTGVQPITWGNVKARVSGP